MCLLKCNIHSKECTHRKYMLTVFRSVPVRETTAWIRKENTDSTWNPSYPLQLPLSLPQR